MNGPSTADILWRSLPHPRDDRQEKGPPLRLIIATFVITVAAFVSTTVATAVRMFQVSVDSERIYANAMPRITALATLRARVRELVTDVNGGADSRWTEQPDFDMLEVEVGAAPFERRTPLCVHSALWRT